MSEKQKQANRQIQKGRTEVKNRYRKSLLISFIVLAPLTSSAQEPTANERLTKGIIQMMTAFTVKRGLDDDSRCRHKSYRDFTIEEIISSMPQSLLKDGTDRLKMEDLLRKMRSAIDTKLPDGTPGFKKAYEEIIESGRKSGVIPNGTDAHCDVMDQQVSRFLQNAKDNFRLANK